METIDVSRPCTNSSTLPVEYELNPSSSQDSSNSLLATIAYQNWCPNSWTVTSSTRFAPFTGHVCKSADLPAVIRVVCSVPAAPPGPNGGCATVRGFYGYRPYHRPNHLMPS